MKQRRSKKIVRREEKIKYATVILFYWISTEVELLTASG